MAYEATIETLRGEPVVKISLPGFDCEYAQDLVDLGAQLNTPIAKRFGLLDCYIENSNSSSFTMFVDKSMSKNGDLSTSGIPDSCDSIEVFQSTTLEGERIFATQIVAAVAIENGRDRGTLERVVLALGHVMTDYREPDNSTIFGSGAYASAEMKYAGTVTEEIRENSKLAVLRFNLVRPYAHAQSEIADILDDPSFMSNAIESTRV